MRPSIKRVPDRGHHPCIASRQTIPPALGKDKNYLSLPRLTKLKKRKEGKHPSFLLPPKVIAKEQIEALVAEVLTDSQFVVDMTIDASNRIYIEVDDRNAPISISDCIKVSRGVEHNLDREEEDFSLEVTSPGLDRPFKVFDQYLKNIGRPVKVKDTSGKVHKGTLTQATPDELTLEYKEKRRIEGRKAKEWVTETISLPMEDVKETFIEIVF